MKVLAGLCLGGAIGLLGGAVISCVGPQKPPQDPNLVRRIEISNLWTQVRQWRSEAKMNLDPPQSMLQWTRDKTVRDVKQKTCREGQPEPTTCSDICSIADNICDNAERICTIADELGKQDDFAQEKCSSAKASCREAKQRCCGCSEAAPPVTGGTW